MRSVFAVVGGVVLVAAGVTPAVAHSIAKPMVLHPAVAAHGPGSPKHAAGDIDGDGRSDLVAGTEHAIHVTYTSATPGGSKLQTFELPDGEPPISLSTGDFNGDGFADLAVGSPFSLPDNASEEDGEVFVYYGASTGLDPSAYSSFPGPLHAKRSWGYTIWALNLNNDGATDLLVDDGNEANKLDVLYGSSHGLKATGSTKFAVKDVGGVAVGDLNGDGRPDLVVGSPDAGKSKSTDHGEIFIGNEGLLSIFLGTKHGFDAKPETIHGLAVGTKYGSLGSDVAIAKVNSDKYADVIAGADNMTLGKKTEAGGLAVLYGGKSGVSAGNRTIVTLDSPKIPGKAIEGDKLGVTIAVSDINGDGYADAIAGATQDDNGRNGEVLVVRGSKHGITSKHSQLLTFNTLPLPTGPSNDPVLYGSQVVAFNPTGLKYGAIAVGGPLYDKAPDYGNGVVDVWVGSKKGFTKSRATRTEALDEKEFFGQALAP